MNTIKNAVISVFDKTGIVPFAKGLNDLGIHIISTGRTAKSLREEGIDCKEVSQITDFPEMLSGRVKTLHPKLHGGILADRSNKEHLATLRKHSIPQIDLVVVNLYPFEETLKRTRKENEIVEMIDIGGPTMLRAAAKNFNGVAAVCDIADYDRVLRELEANKGILNNDFRRYLAAKVFEKTAAYDQAVTEYLCGSAKKNGATSPVLPEKVSMHFVKACDMRYGENPHQRAALYKPHRGQARGLLAAEILGGKQLSYNNYLDLESAWSVARAFKETAATVIKHSSPCGIALGKSAREAFLKAFRCDSLSAFGGIVGINRKIDERCAQAIYDAGFLECVLAPEFSKTALNILKRKKNLRLIRIKMDAETTQLDYRRIANGILLQESDVRDATAKDLKIVTKKQPTLNQVRDLLLAFKICRFVKSNAIVLVKNDETMGIGTGQPSRVDSAIHAFRKAGQRAKGAVMASDGFFPKPDSIAQARKHGIRAIIQPGGSIQDEAVIQAANKANICMVLTGMRHFTH